MKKFVSVTLLLFISVVSSGCGDTVDGQEVDTSRAKLTDGGSYFVEYTPSPDPIPHNELFTMNVSVWESDAKETAVTGAEIAVDATMPAHGHGMNTEPTVTSNGDGTFTVEGMKLHMESPTPEEKWVVGIEVTAGDATETASFGIMCCGK